MFFGWQAGTRIFSCEPPHRTILALIQIWKHAPRRTHTHTHTHTHTQARTRGIAQIRAVAVARWGVYTPQYFRILFLYPKSRPPARIFLKLFFLRKLGSGGGGTPGDQQRGCNLWTIRAIPHVRACVRVCASVCVCVCAPGVCFHICMCTYIVRWGSSQAKMHVPACHPKNKNCAQAK